MEDFNLYIEKGGVIFSILLLLSAVGVTLIFYKIFEIIFFSELNLKKYNDILKSSSDIKEFKSFIEEELNSGNDLFIKEIVEIIDENKSKSEKEDLLEILVQRKYHRAQRFLPTLEIIAQVSPLVGLLGTVIGMIDSFNELELGGSLVDPSILAGGIWTALLTTAMGLIVAIPALISHYCFDKKISILLISVDGFLTNLISKPIR